MATSQFSIIKTNLHDIGFPFLHPADCDSTKIPKNLIPAKPPSPKSYQHSGKSPDFAIIELGIIPSKRNGNYPLLPFLYARNTLLCLCYDLEQNAPKHIENRIQAEHNCHIFSAKRITFVLYKPRHNNFDKTMWLFCQSIKIFMDNGKELFQEIHLAG